MLKRSTDDGLCFFDIASTDDTTVDYATSTEFYFAARALVHRCLAYGDTKGGMVPDLGEFTFRQHPVIPIIQSGYQIEDLIVSRDWYVAESADGFI